MAQQDNVVRRYAIDDLPFMRWLIEQGADVKARSDLDESTLSVAITTGSMDVVRFLLEHEHDVTRGSLLHCAAQRKDQAEGAMLAQELLSRGADANAHRYNNDIALRKRLLSKLPTPLHVTSLEGNLPVAQVLLHYGGNPHCNMLEATKDVPPTPMSIARKRQDERMVDLLSTAYLSEAEERTHTNSTF